MLIQAKFIKMKFTPIILVFAAVLLSLTTSAQSSTNYIIQLGQSDANIESFASLSDIANVYFDQSSESKKKLILGSFSDLQKAEAVTQNLKTQNFPDAYVEPLAKAKGIDVFVVQLGNFATNDQIDWDRYQLNKKVYTTFENGKYRITTGIFPDYESALPLHDQLYQIGFVQAEVIKINSIYLHELNEADISFQRLLHNRGAGKVSEFTAKGAAPVPMISAPNSVKDETPPIVGRVALAKSIAPAINEDFARLSVKNLQSILSVYGNFTSEPNGLYDAKTANAYYATVQLTPSLKEFSAQVESVAHINSGYFTDWSDVELLLKISEDITGNKTKFSDAQLKAQISLYTKPKALGAEDAQRVKDWLVASNDQMNTWKAEGKLSSQTSQAYMLVFTKVEVLLEDYYLDKGFQIEEASNLAKATLYAILVGNFPTV